MCLIHVIRDTLQELRCDAFLIICVNFSLEIYNHCKRPGYSVSFQWFKLHFSTLLHLL